MKTLLLFSLFGLAMPLGITPLFSLSVALAYTSSEVGNASVLANMNIIVDQYENPAAYRLDDTITRAEVIGIALKIKGIILPNYQCKGYYTDVRNNDWICRAVELAADNRIITRDNAKARPQDNITRAEALAIAMKASGNEVGMGGYAGYKYYFDANLYTEGGIGFRDAYNFGATWQAETFYQYIRTILEDDSLLKHNPRASTPATRAEVFGFARNILEKNGTIPTPKIIFGDDITEIERDKLYKYLINPFIDYDSRNDSRVMTSMTITKSDLSEYQYTDEFGNLRDRNTTILYYSINTQYPRGGYEDFGFGENVIVSEYWIPECMGVCSFSDEFTRKYPEIVKMSQ